MSVKKNILVCPLNWGLGHATRIVPVIDVLTEQGANVIIAADKGPSIYLAERYPKLKILKLSGFEPVYPSNRSMAVNMLFSFPKMIKAAKQARIELKKIIEEQHIDAIVSDNRYEIYATKIPSVIITHQLNINTVGIQVLAKPIINLLLNHYLSNFNEIWIPDQPGIELSGKLTKSKKYIDKTYHIGLLSRFYKFSGDIRPIDSDIVIISSGPEPQKSIIQNKLINQFAGSQYKVKVLEGKPGRRVIRTMDNIELYSHVDDDMFVGMLKGARIIISRPGYSTLMDLFTLGKTGIFIPTPGQTEQIYLGNRLFNEGRAVVLKQDQINQIRGVIEEFPVFDINVSTPNSILLEKRISHLLKIC